MPMADINKLPNDGYLVFPLSMSRLQKGQSPGECMDILERFNDKVSVPSIDVVFLYTNGLYFNTDDQSFAMRKKTNGQMLSHRNALKKLIMNRKDIPKYIPNAFHFLPFDYVILNADNYQSYFERLQRSYRSDAGFKSAVRDSMTGRPADEANVNFIIEELVISHLIRNHEIEFPKTIVSKDTFRLIVYPGSVIPADAYCYKHRLLPRKERGQRYQGALYDASACELVDLTDL
jgi:hypothetical protein